MWCRIHANLPTQLSANDNKTTPHWEKNIKPHFVVCQMLKSWSNRMTSITLLVVWLTWLCHAHCHARQAYMAVQLWHFQVEIGSLWDCEYKAWTNVTTVLLMTHIQLESVTITPETLRYEWTQLLVVIQVQLSTTLEITPVMLSM